MDVHEIINHGNFFSTCEKRYVASALGPRSTGRWHAMGIELLQVRADTKSSRVEARLTASSIIGLLMACVLAIAPYVFGSSGSEALIADSHARFPVRCHSHNDYWRRRPLDSALEAGCISVEADVWAVEQQLYVGHNLGDLSPGRTLSNLYVEPLARLLQTSPGGIYPMHPTQTLVLMVDLKTEPDRTWPLLMESLDPLRQRGWLTYVEGGKTWPGPITIVASGSTELVTVLDNGPRLDVFLDAPLAKLSSGSFNSSNSYYASVSFRKSIGLVDSKGLSDEQAQKIREQTQMAQARGLKARYWDLPAWPLEKRNHVWDVLIREGVSVLNADDLRGARHFLTE